MVFPSTVPVMSDPSVKTPLFAFVEKGHTPDVFKELLAAMESGSGPMCVRPDAPAEDVSTLLQAFAREAAAPAAKVWSPSPIARFLETGDAELAATVDQRAADHARRGSRKSSMTQRLPHRAAGVVSWAARAHRPELIDQVAFSVHGCLITAASFAGFAAALDEFRAGGHRRVSSYWSDGLERNVRESTQSQLVARLTAQLSSGTRASSRKRPSSRH